MTDIHEGYVTLKEASAITGVSVRRLQDMVRGYWSRNVRQGTRTWCHPVVPSTRVGRTYLIRREDLSYVDSRRRRGEYPRRQPEQNGEGA